jgi:hypothetical protein
MSCWRWCYSTDILCLIDDKWRIIRQIWFISLPLIDILPQYSQPNNSIMIVQVLYYVAKSIIHHTFDILCESGAVKWVSINNLDISISLLYQLIVELTMSIDGLYYFINICNYDYPRSEVTYIWRLTISLLSLLIDEFYVWWISLLYLLSAISYVTSSSP